MAGRKYDRVSIEDFGKHLLDSGDLDPIYKALYELNLPMVQRQRWLLAYFCFYNAGLASFLSEQGGDQYWTTFRVAAANLAATPAPIGGQPHNGNWPRGKERRHFRGAQATKATDELSTKYSDPAFAFNHLIRVSDQEPISFSVISARVQEWRGFGNWISFKVGDMIDRVGVAKVSFSFADAMYDEPRKAALMQWKIMHGAPQESTIDDEKAAVQEVVDYLIKHFSTYLAPPLGDRPIGYPEVETILCKWKSHLGGHYPFFNDMDEIAAGVAPWVKTCDTARRFAEAMPKRPKAA